MGNSSARYSDKDLYLVVLSNGSRRAVTAEQKEELENEEGKETLEKLYRRLMDEITMSEIELEDDSLS
ncbi:MAG TPA: hypothetical protein DEP72_08460 [Clostridiales bacterium]|nr:MAG: hypothetical protein A2Y18_07355 [Clostridiales bacterium GWD2_32_19]HCC08169.1 hypothetical protein [Clostridiales bacterium]